MTTKRDILATFEKNDLLNVSACLGLEADDDATAEDLRILVEPVIAVPKRVFFAALSKAAPPGARRGPWANKGRAKVTTVDLLDRPTLAECTAIEKALSTWSHASLKSACTELGLPADGLTNGAFIERLLAAVMFSNEEREHLVNAFLDLTNDRIRERLKVKGVKTTERTKAGYRESLVTALERGDVTYRDLVGWLDEVDPWRAQQVFLLHGRPGGIDNWPDAAYVQSQLAGHEHEVCFNTTVPVVLPAKMRVSSIQHSAERLRVIAYVRRSGRERVKELDQSKVLDDGRRIVWNAYHEYVVRAALVFDWDFVTNTAMIRVTQMPEREKHEDVRDAFRDELRGWLRVIDEFAMLDLHASIPALDRHAALKNAEVRPYKMAYNSAGGRVVEGSTGAPHQPFHGEASFDNGWQQLRDNGVGRHGNFHWLANGAELTENVHASINAKANRVRFYVDLDEVRIHHVLARIRHYCR